MEKEELNLNCYLREAISDKDWGDAAHYSRMLLDKGYLNNGRRGWRLFECEKYEVKFSHGIEKYGCGSRFLMATRDFTSPSSETCPICSASMESEEVYPLLGFFDANLEVDSHFNLTKYPEDIILTDEMPQAT